jgi:hypothetical protein
MTIVIVRPVAAWSDFGHSEIEACGARVFLRSNQSSSATPFAVRDQSSSLLGGELPGGVKVKLGDKVLRGNVGVGDNGGNFKAGVGLPF